MAERSRVHPKDGEMRGVEPEVAGQSRRDVREVARPEQREPPLLEEGPDGRTGGSEDVGGVTGVGSEVDEATERVVHDREMHEYDTSPMAQGS